MLSAKQNLSHHKIPRSRRTSNQKLDLFLKQPGKKPAFQGGKHGPMGKMKTHKFLKSDEIKKINLKNKLFDFIKLNRPNLEIHKTFKIKEQFEFLKFLGKGSSGVVRLCKRLVDQKFFISKILNIMNFKSIVYFKRLKVRILILFKSQIF